MRGLGRTGMSPLQRGERMAVMSGGRANMDRWRVLEELLMGSGRQGNPG